MSSSLQPLVEFNKYDKLIKEYTTRFKDKPVNISLKIKSVDGKDVTQSSNDNFIPICYFTTDVSTTQVLNDINNLQNEGGSVVLSDLFILIPNRNEPCGVKALYGFSDEDDVSFNITIKQNISDKKQSWSFDFKGCKIITLALSKDGIILEFKIQRVEFESQKKTEAINGETDGGIGPTVTEAMEDIQITESTIKGV